MKIFKKDGEEEEEEVRKARCCKEKGGMAGK